MSYVCEICGKKPLSGNKRSHSNIKTRTRWIPNLQNVRIIIKGTVQRAKVCTNCLRSGKAQKAPIRKHLVKAK
ncbi:MAG: 50S ribosomal protein L28 [Candidatus Margulisbacteria bacterium]|nr:50S ribosomal protein L28 [Candidatus Margulisiibacteriota bacterium]